VNGILTLARHSVARSRVLILVLTAVLAGFEILLVVAAQTLQESGTFGSFAALVPPFMRQVFGDALIVFMSFAGVVCFGFFHPMVVAALAAFVIAIATEPVAEIESRFLDVVLARPIPRSTVVGRSALLMALLSAAVVAAMVAATLVALHTLTPAATAAPATRLILSLAANLWALLFSLGGLALAVSAASRRRSAAVGVVGLAALALFFVDYLARIWKPAASMVRLSPFHYYDAMAMVMGRPLPAGHMAVLAGSGLAGIALAFVLFSRRDV
jgi:ABC-2 type transport system permease protein